MSTVVLLELVGREHGQGVVQPLCVVPVGPVHGRRLRICQLLERACLEGAVLADAFVLIQADRGFREDVVVRVADAADGSRQAVKQQCLSEPDRGFRAYASL